MSIAPLTVKVPATSANLGPGFDVLGLALSLYNTFIIRPATVTRMESAGTGHNLPRGETNLFYRAFAHLYALAAEEPPPLHVTMQLSVPSGRGLGSSATAVVGGLLAANAALGAVWSREQLLAEAVKLEHGGHADNVAPALFGGLVVSVTSDRGVISVRLPFPPELRAVLFVPEFHMDTVKGRELMPAAYSKTDTLFNTGRVALFMAALQSRRYDLLEVAMQDRMHQPYRTKLFPALPALIRAALDAGAYGACLSGGGSSVLALGDTEPEAIAASMQGTAEKLGVAGTTHILEINSEGATVEKGEQ